MLAVLCYVYRYGIVCPSISICGSIFIYYKRALLVYGCMRTLRVEPYNSLLCRTWQFGPGDCQFYQFII